MSAWELLMHSEYDAVWDNFEEQFNFKPTVNLNQFPSSEEPIGSITYQFEYPAESANKAIDDVNYKSLTVFQNLVPLNDAIYALDW